MLLPYTAKITLHVYVFNKIILLDWISVYSHHCGDISPKTLQIIWNLKPQTSQRLRLGLRNYMYISYNVSRMNNAYTHSYILLGNII